MKTAKAMNGPAPRCITNNGLAAMTMVHQNARKMRLSVETGTPTPRRAAWRETSVPATLGS